MDLEKRIDLRWIAKQYLPKRLTDLLRATLPEWIYYPGYGHTTLSSKKLDQLLNLLKSTLAKNIDGDLLECGVFRGGSLVEIAQMTKNMQPGKQVFGADTFEGHPFDSAEDVPPDNKLVHHRGLFAGNNFERVAGILEDSGLSNTTLLKGVLEETLPSLNDKRFCFAHLDLDLYLSTKQALAFVEPRLAPGGVIVFDDYGSFDAPGVERAVSELIPDAKIEISPIDPSEGSQAYWIKPGA